MKRLIMVCLAGLFVLAGCTAYITITIDGVGVGPIGTPTPIATLQASSTPEPTQQATIEPTVMPTVFLPTVTPFFNPTPTREITTWTPQPPELAVINVNIARVRQSPTVNSLQVAALERGDIVEIELRQIDENGAINPATGNVYFWYEIITDVDPFLRGWVREDLVIIGD
jgi:hypothetical protein